MVSCFLSPDLRESTEMGEGFIHRAPLPALREVFTRYASVTDRGEKFLTYKDFVVSFLGLLPEHGHNPDTLALYGGVLDQGKDGAALISFQEFVAFEAHLCRPDALYRAAFQLFDRDGGGSVGFLEFRDIMQRTSLHRWTDAALTPCRELPFDMEGSFVQLYFGRERERNVRGGWPSLFPGVLPRVLTVPA